jgi:hypothetical protein
MPKININMQWLIPIATVAWGLWTWAADRERERIRERARISALYVSGRAQKVPDAVTHASRGAGI